MSETTLRNGEHRVLITGASGFLGKYAVEEFVKYDYSVIATGRNLEALSILEQPGITIFASDLDQLSTTKLQVDTVVHAAALSSIWGRWQDFHKSNVEGTNNVIRFAARNGVQRLVYVSSPSIYSGGGDKHNIREDEIPTGGKLNNYIRSKIIAEKNIHSAHQAGLIPEIAIVRPRGLIGIGDPSLVPRLLEANKKTGIPLFYEGQNIVDLTCVENVALALRLASEAPSLTYNAYNITNGEPAKFKDLVDRLFSALGEVPRYKNIHYKVAYGLAVLLEKTFMLHPNNPEPPLTRYTVTTLAHSQTLDITKAKSELGYRPTITLAEGIERVAEHYRRMYG